MEPSGPRSAVSSPVVTAVRRPPRLLWGALVFPAAVLAVHQLRYLLAYGSRAGSELSAHGDHYVAAATVIAAVLVLISLGVGLVTLAASRGSGHLEIARAPLWLLWLGFTLLLVAGFCVLEGLEIGFESHHAAGVVGIFGDGGWWALPAAAFVGALIALLVQGGRALLVVAARRRRSRRAPVSTAPHRALQREVRPDGPMATCAAGRAPPLSEPV